MLKWLCFAGFLFSTVSGEVPSEITVGAVLKTHHQGNVFTNAISTANSETDSASRGFHLNSTYIIINENPILAAEMICEELIPRQVYVVITSHAPRSSVLPMAVSFTCGFYNIPVIGVSVRESVFSDKNLHPFFMRTVAPFSDQAEVWVHMLLHFRFKNVVFIHSSSPEGRAILSKFQRKAEIHDIEIEKIQYSSGEPDYTKVLSSIPALKSRVILLYASTEDAERIYRKATSRNLTAAGYAWLVTEQALLANNTPVGVLGLRLRHSAEEEAHIIDSVKVISNAFKELSQKENLTEAPNMCDRHPSRGWNGGALIFRYLHTQQLEKGETGQVRFNYAGDRFNPAYDIINAQKKSQVVVGTFNTGKNLEIKESNIIWPGEQTIKPKGIKISTHLKVVTIDALPFIYTDAVDLSRNSCRVDLGKYPCPRFNSTDGTQQDFCCYGYAIDLLARLSQKVNFTFELHLVEDNQYGSYERRNGSKKSWNGMIGELISGKSDLIVAPLTINPERAEHIDFSKPFKYQGLTILVKKTTKDSSLGSFLQPFQDTLWILVGLSVHVVALVLYLLDRFSPFGRFKLAKSDDTEEDALNLSSAMWFAWGVLLNSGIGEGTPRSFSARVLGMVWAGFAMIIVASYTANLAAFLVLDRPEASISGIDDARLRNPQEDFRYATVKNSAVAMYFKRQVELSTMYRTMESRGNYDTELEAIQHVRIEKLHAFIWDSSRLDYEAANDCDLVTAGELFGRSGYGIGLRKESPWTEIISLDILGFHESGYMEQLDGKWILVKDTKCPEKDTSPATLGLTNMAGVFMMVAGGIVTGVVLIVIEITYKRHRGLKEKELELAKTAADRWRGNIEKRRNLRHALLMQQQQERNKVTNGTTDNSPSCARLPSYSPGHGPSGYLPVATSLKTADQVAALC